MNNAEVEDDKFWSEEIDTMKHYLTAEEFKDAMSPTHLNHYKSKVNSLRKSCVEPTKSKPDEVVDDDVDDDDTRNNSSLNAIVEYFSKQNRRRKRPRPFTYFKNIHNNRCYKKEEVHQCSSKGSPITSPKVVSPVSGFGDNTAKSRKRKIGSSIPVDITNNKSDFDNFQSPRKKLGVTHNGSEEGIVDSTIIISPKIVASPVSGYGDTAKSRKIKVGSNSVDISKSDFDNVQSPRKKLGVIQNGSEEGIVGCTIVTSEGVISPVSDYGDTAKSRKRKAGVASIDDYKSNKAEFDHVHSPKKSSTVKSSQRKAIMKDIASIDGYKSNKAEFDHVCSPKHVNEAALDVKPIITCTAKPRQSKAITMKDVIARKKAGCYIPLLDEGALPPREYVERIEELKGSEIKVRVEKKLTKTDVNKGHSRLLFPINIVEKSGLLNEVEIKELNEGKKPLVKILVPSTLNCGNNDARIVTNKWTMANNFYYALMSPWNKVVEDNKFKEGDVLQLWSFRYPNEVPGTLGLALVKTYDAPLPIDIDNGSGFGGGDGGGGGSSSSVCSS